MKLNLPVRLKNPVFWAQLGLAVLTPILAYFGLTGADITSWPLLDPAGRREQPLCVRAGRRERLERPQRSHHRRPGRQ